MLADTVVRKSESGKSSRKLKMTSSSGVKPYLLVVVVLIVFTTMSLRLGMDVVSHEVNPNSASYSTPQTSKQPGLMLTQPTFPPSQRPSPPRAGRNTASPQPSLPRAETKKVRPFAKPASLKGQKTLPVTGKMTKPAAIPTTFKVVAAMEAFDELSYQPAVWGRVDEEGAGFMQSFEERSTAFLPNSSALQQHALRHCSEADQSVPFEKALHCNLRDGCYSGESGECFPGTAALMTGVAGMEDQPTLLSQFLPASAASWPSPPEPVAQPPLRDASPNAGDSNPQQVRSIGRVMPTGGLDASESKSQDSSGSSPELVCSFQSQVPTKLEAQTFLGHETIKTLGKVAAAKTDQGVGDEPAVAQSSVTLSADAQLDVFKYVTGAQFERWYDWDAPIVRTNKSSTEDFYFSARTYSTGMRKLESQAGEPLNSSQRVKAVKNRVRDQLYMLSNFCVRPDGRLAGYPSSGSPPDTFAGGTEVTAYTGAANWEEEMYFHEWLTDIDKLPEKPQWYVDRPLVIVPMVGEWSVHPGHVLQRIGNAVWNVESAFPRNPNASQASSSSFARDDVTAMYVHVETPPGVGNAFTTKTQRPSCRNVTGSCQWADYGYQLYTTLATTTHFTTSTSFVPEMAAQQFSQTPAGASLSRQEIEGMMELAFQRPICFKEAVVWQACPYSDCNRPHAGNAWPLYGWRNPITQQMVAKRFRACAGVEHLARSRLDPANLTVLFQFRTEGARVIHHSAHLAAVVDRWLGERKAGRLVAASLKGSLIEFTAVYSQVDIVISPYGSGLLYGFLTPPGSAGIEIAYHGINMGTFPGINANPINDYGSLWAAQAGSHVAVQLEALVARWYARLEVPPKLLLRSLRSAMCAIAEQSTSLPGYLVLESATEDERWALWADELNTTRAKYNVPSRGTSLSEVLAEARASLEVRGSTPEQKKTLLLQSLWSEGPVRFHQDRITPDDPKLARCALGSFSGELQDMRDDPDGTHLRRALREFISAHAEDGIVDSNNGTEWRPSGLNFRLHGWLVAMMEQADQVAAPVFASLRQFSLNHEGSVLPAAVTILIHCPLSAAHRKELHMKLRLEILFLRRYLFARTQIVVMTRNPCRDFPLDSKFIAQELVKAPPLNSHDGLPGNAQAAAVGGGVHFCGVVWTKKNELCHRLLGGGASRMVTVLVDADVKKDPQALGLLNKFMRHRSGVVVAFERQPRGSWRLEVLALEKARDDSNLYMEQLGQIRLDIASAEKQKRKDAQDKAVLGSTSVHENAQLHLHFDHVCQPQWPVNMSIPAVPVGKVLLDARQFEREAAQQISSTLSQSTAPPNCHFVPHPISAALRDSCQVSATRLESALEDSLPRAKALLSAFAQDPYSRVPRCSPLPGVRCRLPPQGGRKLLILYELGVESNPDEFTSYSHFWRTTVMKSRRFRSEVSDGVDFVFFQVLAPGQSMDIREKGLCFNAQNIRLIFLPPFMSQAEPMARRLLALAYLGYRVDGAPSLFRKGSPHDHEATERSKNWSYHSVLFVGSAMRGPFSAVGDSSRSEQWLDFVGVGSTEMPFRTIVSLSMRGGPDYRLEEEKESDFNLEKYKPRLIDGIDAVELRDRVTIPHGYAHTIDDEHLLLIPFPALSKLTHRLWRMTEPSPRVMEQRSQLLDQIADSPSTQLQLFLEEIMKWSFTMDVELLLHAVGSTAPGLRVLALNSTLVRGSSGEVAGLGVVEAALASVQDIRELSDEAMRDPASVLHDRNSTPEKLAWLNAHLGYDLLGEYLDPCATLFVPFSSTARKSGRIHESTWRDAQRLSLASLSSGGGNFKELLREAASEDANHGGPADDLLRDGMSPVWLLELLQRGELIGNDSCLVDVV